MRKNRMMRLASALLILTMVTTCAISGTFAKYVTQDSAEDSARVAKWGISLQAIGNLYGESYDDEIVADDYENLAVQVYDVNNVTQNVIAPGTKNDDGLSFGLTGQPEVDYQIDATIKSQNIFLKNGTYGLMVPVEAGKITAENFANFKSDLYTTADSETYSSAGDTFSSTATYYTLEDSVVVNATGTAGTYYPVVYKMVGGTSDSDHVDGFDYKDGAVTVDSLDAIAGIIAARLNGGTALAAEGTDNQRVTTYTLTAKQYETNVDVAGLQLQNQCITWAWAFEFDGTDDEKAMYNGADTILGNLQADDGADGVEGAVVKLVGGNYVVPEEYEDYCLDTQFSIDITVTQVD